MTTTVIERLVYDLGMDLADFDRGIDQAQSKLSSAGRKMSDLGKSLTLGVTTPILAMGAGMLKVGGDFEATMHGVKAISGATAEEFSALSEKAKELGATTKFSATESAKGIEVLLKNGLKANEVLGGAADASLTLASATGTNLANAADIATDAMADFDIAAEDMASAVDQITGVTVNSKFSIDDYRLAIAQAGGVAGSVGVEFEDFNAVVAATASKFASGSDAGTSFKVFLQRLVPQSKEAAEKMDELGLKFFDAEGNMNSMADVAQSLQDALSGLNEEAKIDVASTLFGTDAMRTALGLADAGKEGIDSMKGLIDEVDALAQSEERLTGFNAALIKMKSALESLGIAAAESGALSFATDMADDLADLFREMSKANPELLQMGIVLAAMAALIGPLLIALGAISAAIAAISWPVAAVIAGVVAITAAFVTWQEEIMAVVNWIKELVMWLGKIGGKVLDFVTAPGAMVADLISGGSTTNTSTTNNNTTVNIAQPLSRSDVSAITTEANRQEDRG